MTLELGSLIAVSLTMATALSLLSWKLGSMEARLSAVQVVLERLMILAEGGLCAIHTNKLAEHDRRLDDLQRKMVGE